tara:strand:+ start:407 stop:934 length:528 start_codon:yes stop_codon:yes gene_type:complete
MGKKIVYVGLSADIMHKGHINILKTAKRYGDVTVGLLTDKAISTYKNVPYLNFAQRKIIIENIKYVKRVIPQNTLDYTQNLKKIKPDYVIHGDDWRSGVQKKTREKVIKYLKKNSGKLIELKYTKGISSSLIKNKIFNLLISELKKTNINIIKPKKISDKDKNKLLEIFNIISKK